MIKTKDYKSELVKYTILPLDIINIICDYNEKIINLKIEAIDDEPSSYLYHSSSLILPENLEKTNITVRVRVTWEKMIDIVFYYNNSYIPTIHIQNIFLNIMNFDASIQYYPNYDHKLSFSKSYNENWMFPNIINEDLYVYDIYFSNNNVQRMNSIHFFNLFMKHFYNESQYFDIDDNNKSQVMLGRTQLDELCLLLDYKIFINKKTLNGYKYEYVFMYPLDHTKIKNIIIMIEILKKQIDEMVQKVYKQIIK